MKNSETKKLNNAGFTLVELLVAFALLGLFMIAVTRVLSYTVMLYQSTTSMSEGIEVSSILANKLTGVLEKATDITDINSGRFINEDENEVEIVVDDGYIVIIYSEDEAPDGSTIGEVSWRFDQRAYMGYKVRSLSFEKQPAGCDPNVIRMTITLYNNKYRDDDYVQEYYIKCVNVSE